MSLPVRAASTEIPRRKRWSLTAAYECERESIRRWLEAQATELLFKTGKVDDALAAGQALPGMLEGVFAGSPALDARLMIAAERGQLEREAPGRVAIGVFLTLMLILAVLEIAVFAWQWLMEEGNWFLLVQGALLAAGGLFLGLGASERWMPAEQRDFGSSSRARWVFVIGVAIVVGVSFLRAWGAGWEGWVVVVATLALALGIALFEALHRTQEGRRRVLTQQMFQCQGWYAARRHRDDLERGVWRMMYETAVKTLAEGVAAAVRVQPESDRQGSAAQRGEG